LLPERQIGLSAHDYQQAACGPRVVLSRSKRDADAQTIPSRWLNRLTNLLGGQGEAGDAALRAMRARGEVWLRIAETLDAPRSVAAPAPRPAPRPEVGMRPKEISITEVQRLIRDPYQIYAQRILRLSPLDPLRRIPDPRLRGILLHKVFEAFISGPFSGDSETDRAALMAATDRVLSELADWPSAQRLWRKRVEKIADWFVTTEAQRRRNGAPLTLEAKGRLDLPDIGTSLVGKIDRIDRLTDGRLAVFDYKTGAIPSASVQDHFDKQLLLSALMAEQGLLDTRDSRVGTTGYIGIGTAPKFAPREVTRDEIERTRAELQALLARYQKPEQGYAARRAVATTGADGDFDHLARYGEWDESDPPSAEEVR
jgi:RecB family exonuclease